MNGPLISEAAYQIHKTDNICTLIHYRADARHMDTKYIALDDIEAMTEQVRFMPSLTTAFAVANCAAHTQLSGGQMYLDLIHGVLH